MSYKVEKGDVLTGEGLEIRAFDLLLLDVGTAGGTEFEVTDPENIDGYTDFVEANIENGRKIGLIHTHHSMSTFFSGTDQDTLEDLAKTHNYALSMIVNYEGGWIAKVAYMAEAETTVTKASKVKPKYFPDKIIETSSEEDNKFNVLIHTDLTLTYPETLIHPWEKELQEKIDLLSTPKYVQNFYSYDDDDWGGYWGRNKQKTVNVSSSFDDLEALAKKKEKDLKKKETSKKVNPDVQKEMVMALDAFISLLNGDDSVSNGMRYDFAMKKLGYIQHYSQLYRLFGGKDRDKTEKAIRQATNQDVKEALVKMSNTINYSYVMFKNLRENILGRKPLDSDTFYVKDLVDTILNVPSIYSNDVPAFLKEFFVLETKVKTAYDSFSLKDIAKVKN